MATSTSITASEFRERVAELYGRGEAQALLDFALPALAQVKAKLTANEYEEICGGALEWARMMTTGHQVESELDRAA